MEEHCQLEHQQNDIPSPTTNESQESKESDGEASLDPEVLVSEISDCVIIEEEKKPLTFSLSDEIQVIETHHKASKFSSHRTRGKQNNVGMLHLDQSVTCAVCDKHFLGKKNLRLHMNYHSTHKPVTCGVCKQPFTRDFNVRKHLLLHKHGNYVTCGVCNKPFSQQRFLDIHMSSHTHASSLRCDLCNVLFPTSTSLNFHMNIHTQFRPHSCDVCGKAFYLELILNMHKKRHIAEEIYAKRYDFLGSSIDSTTKASMHEK